jgi:hypothetical protein
MKTLIAVLIGLLATASVAHADGVKAFGTPRFPALSGEAVNPNRPSSAPAHRGVPHASPHHRVRAGVVFVTPPPVLVYAAPRQCVSPGYWTYQWIPTSYTQSIWVPAGFTAEGAWIDGHFEQRAYASGYYQPHWIPDQAYAC